MESPPIPQRLVIFKYVHYRGIFGQGVVVGCDGEVGAGGGGGRG